VLGVFNAVTHEMITVTNEAYINAQSCFQYCLNPRLLNLNLIGCHDSELRTMSWKTGLIIIVLLLGWLPLGISLVGLWLVRYCGCRIEVAQVVCNDRPRLSLMLTNLIFIRHWLAIITAPSSVIIAVCWWLLL
jgi:hypothetical protein